MKPRDYIIYGARLRKNTSYWVVSAIFMNTWSLNNVHIMIGWRIIMGAYNYRNNIVIFFQFYFISTAKKLQISLDTFVFHLLFKFFLKKIENCWRIHYWTIQCQYKWSLVRSLVYELDVHKIHRQIISFSLLMISCTRGPYIVTRIKSCQSIALILTWLE